MSNSHSYFIKLQILAAHAPLITAHLESDKDAQDADLFEAIERNDVKFVEYHFDSLDASDFLWLDRFVKQGIAYSLMWEHDLDKCAGSQHVRFTAEGDIRHRFLNPGTLTIPVASLLKLFYTRRPDAIREMLVQQHLATQVLPWDNQIEYGKRYQLRELTHGVPA